MSGSELLSELAQQIGADDGGLRSEDLISVLVAKAFAPGVEPAGVDGGLEAPIMHGQREVAAYPGNLVLGHGLFEQRVGAGAVGALHVCKLDQGYAGSGGRPENRGVEDPGSGWRSAKLSVGAGG